MLTWWRSDRARQFEAKAWGWRAASWLCVGVYLFAPPIWKALSVLYLAWVSNAAMVATNLGNAEAARAAAQTGPGEAD